MKLLFGVSMIVAVSTNGVIGRGGKLPWEGGLRGDMAFFKKTTIGDGNNVVIMGRNTFESLPEGKPLPGRVTIVLTRSTDRSWLPSFCNIVHNCTEAQDSMGASQPCVIIAGSLEEALKIASDSNYIHGEDREVFIIGGGMIYDEARKLEEVSKVYLTRVLTDIDDGDTFFPDLDEDWEEAKRYKSHEPNEHNMFGRQVLIYERKTSEVADA